MCKWHSNPNFFTLCSIPLDYFIISNYEGLSVKRAFFLLCLLFPLLYGRSKLSVKSVCQFYVFRIWGLGKTLSHHMFLMSCISFYHFYEFMLLVSYFYYMEFIFVYQPLRVYHCFHHMNNQLHNGIHKIVYALHTELKLPLYLMWIFF